MSAEKEWIELFAFKIKQKPACYRFQMEVKHSMNRTSRKGKQENERKGGREIKKGKNEKRDSKEGTERESKKGKEKLGV